MNVVPVDDDFQFIQSNATGSNDDNASSIIEVDEEMRAQMIKEDELARKDELESNNITDDQLLRIRLKTLKINDECNNIQPLSLGDVTSEFSLQDYQLAISNAKEDAYKFLYSMFMNFYMRQFENISQSRLLCVDSLIALICVHKENSVKVINEVVKFVTSVNGISLNRMELKSSLHNLMNKYMKAEDGSRIKRNDEISNESLSTIDQYNQVFGKTFGQLFNRLMSMHEVFNSITFPDTVSGFSNVSKSKFKIKINETVEAMRFKLSKPIMVYVTTKQVKIKDGGSDATLFCVEQDDANAIIEILKKQINFAGNIPIFDGISVGQNKNINVLDLMKPLINDNFFVTSYNYNAYCDRKLMGVIDHIMISMTLPSSEMRMVKTYLSPFKLSGKIVHLIDVWNNQTEFERVI